MDDAADKLWGIRTQISALVQDQKKLEAHAGIAETAEKLRTDAPHYEFVYDAAERFSDRQRELEDHEQRIHEKKTTRRLRDLYFSVRDAELRKALIAKEREIGELGVYYWQQDLAVAAARLNNAKSARQNWWVRAAIVGVLFIGLGFYFFSFIGALGGLLVGYLWSRETQHRAISDGEKAVEEANRLVREAEQTWNEARNEPLMFSQREAKTGEQDPK